MQLLKVEPLKDSVRLAANQNSLQSSKLEIFITQNTLNTDYL